MSIYDSLNPQQKEAVFHYEGPLLVLAGAGSGKTRVLTYRVAWLIEEKHVNPRSIMAITFTNKAAGEMRDRIRQLLLRDRPETQETPFPEGAVGGVWVATFHSTCVRILRQYISCIGYKPHFTIYDTDDQKAVVREICKTMDIDTKLYREYMFMSIISRAKDEMKTPEELISQAGDDIRRKLAAEVYREYEKRLLAANALDFDDLICKTVELFQRYPEVLEQYQERFRFILVDEYQDTNTAQFQLIRMLAAKYRNLCVVGDDDQSIYRFRGANISNILNFEEIFPDTKTIRLEQNYRSTQNILDTANAVIQKNTGRKPKTLWTANGEGSRVQFRQFANSFEEAEFIVGLIQGKVESGEWHYGDCAILYRANAQSRLFEEKMVQANIPYKLVGGVNFYARREIKDVLAYLKTIANDDDDLAVRRIINVPKRGIGATTISRVQEYALQNQLSFYEALCIADQIPGIGKGAAKLLDFVKMIQAFRSRQEFCSVREMIEDVVETTGYRKELEKEGSNEAREREENIDELLNKAVSYTEQQEEPSLFGFLEEVALIADIDTLQEDPDHVLMMTFHGAKGLEFPVVFLGGMEDGVFPSYQSVTSGDPLDLEEERRLCYVGITRARKELYLTSARQRMVRGEIHYNRISRFILDMPETVFARKKQPAPEKKPKEPIVSAKQKAYQQLRETFHTKAFAAQKPEISKESGLSYGIGDRVSHIKFGEGTVQAIADGGRDYEVTVAFDRVGTKKMFAAFAKLKKI